MLNRPKSRTYEDFLIEIDKTDEIKFKEQLDFYVDEYKQYLLGTHAEDVYDDKYDDIERTILSTDSPIERMFYIAVKHELIYKGYVEGNEFLLLPQYEVESYSGTKYYVDFALLYADFQKEKFYSLFIELNGHDYHSNKAQLTRDKKRERDLENYCDRLITFTGTEIYTDPLECADEAISTMNIIIREKR